MIQHREDLNEDWFIGNDSRDELWVCDREEGDRLFAVPESIDDNSQALIDVAILITLAKDSSFDRGKRAGREEVQRDLQHLLGMDRIAIALEEMAARS